MGLEEGYSAAAPSQEGQAANPTCGLPKALARRNIFMTKKNRRSKAAAACPATGRALGTQLFDFLRQSRELALHRVAMKFSLLGAARHLGLGVSECSPRLFPVAAVYRGLDLLYEGPHTAGTGAVACGAAQVLANPLPGLGRMSHDVGRFPFRSWLGRLIGPASGCRQADSFATRRNAAHLWKAWLGTSMTGEKQPPSKAGDRRPFCIRSTMSTSSRKTSSQRARSR